MSLLMKGQLNTWLVVLEGPIQSPPSFWLDSRITRTKLPYKPCDHRGATPILQADESEMLTALTESMLKSTDAGGC